MSMATASRRSIDCSPTASLYDAVVLDVMLPGKDGFSVVKQLRSEGHYVPVLMLTARSRPEDVLHGFESGADDYLPKPFELHYPAGALARPVAAP